MPSPPACELLRISQQWLGQLVTRAEPEGYPHQALRQERVKTSPKLHPSFGGGKRCGCFVHLFLSPMEAGGLQKRSSGMHKVVTVPISSSGENPEEAAFMLEPPGSPWRRGHWALCIYMRSGCSVCSSSGKNPGMTLQHQRDTMMSHAPGLCYVTALMAKQDAGLDEPLA